MSLCLFCGNLGASAAALSRELDITRGEFMVAIGMGQIRDGERRSRKAEIERTSWSHATVEILAFHF